MCRYRFNIHRMCVLQQARTLLIIDGCPSVTIAKLSVTMSVGRMYFHVLAQRIFHRLCCFIERNTSFITHTSHYMVMFPLVNCMC